MMNGRPEDIGRQAAERALRSAGSDRIEDIRSQAADRAAEVPEPPQPTSPVSLQLIDPNQAGMLEQALQQGGAVPQVHPGVAPIAPDLTAEEYIWVVTDVELVGGGSGGSGGDGTVTLDADCECSCSCGGAGGSGGTVPPGGSGGSDCSCSCTCTVDVPLGECMTLRIHKRKIWVPWIETSGGSYVTDEEDVGSVRGCGGAGGSA